MLSRLILAGWLVLFTSAVAPAGPLPWSYWVRLNAPDGCDGILFGTEVMPPATDSGPAIPYHIFMDTGLGNYGRVRIHLETDTEPTDLFHFSHGDWQTVVTLPAGKTYSPNTFAISWGFQGQNGSASASTTGTISASGVFTTGTGNFTIGLDHSERVTVDGQSATVQFRGVNDGESSRIEMTVTPYVPAETPEPGTFVLAGIAAVGGGGAWLKRRRK